MTNKIIFKKGQRWILPKYDNLEVEITGVSMSDKVQVKFTSIFDTVVTTSLSRDSVYWETAKLVMEEEEPVHEDVDLIDGEFYVKETDRGAWVFRFKNIDNTALPLVDFPIRAYYATLLTDKPTKELLSVGSIIGRDKKGVRTATKEEVTHLETVANKALNEVEGDLVGTIVSFLATPYQTENFYLADFKDPKKLLEFIITVKEPVDDSGEPLVDGNFYKVVTDIDEAWVFRYKKPNRTEKLPKQTSCYSCMYLGEDDEYYATSGFVTADGAPITKATQEEENVLVLRDHQEGNLVFKDLD